jgi:hypothetical protein
MTPGLVEFIRARLDERAAQAVAAQQRHPSPWRLRSHESDYWMVTDSGAGEVVIYDEGVPSQEAAAFIVANDPTHVLADVAAKRALIEEIEGLETQIDNEWGSGRGFPDGETALRFLAAPFAGHPDFHPSWAVPVTGEHP